MNKLFILGILSIAFSSISYNVSTKAGVVLAGGIIKARHIQEEEKKPLRKDCPVCKGTGKVVSGDKLNTTECQYCVPPNKKIGASPENCTSGTCIVPNSPPRSIIIRK